MSEYHVGNYVSLLSDIKNRKKRVREGLFGEYDSFNTHIKYITFLLYHDMHD